MIQQLSTLAEIPQTPILSGVGVWAADVVAIAGSKKRKRSELAVAFDGVGVNIYDARSSRLTNSYAVPPQSVFTCSPCSIRSKGNEIEAPQRTTYCSVTCPKPRIICFSDIEHASKNHESHITNSTFDIQHTKSPLICLETFYCKGDDAAIPSQGLLAVHEDGEVRCFSRNLQKELWKAKAIGAQSVRIEYGTVISLEQARKGILRSREDVVATLGVGMDFEAPNSVETSLLVLISRSMITASLDQNEVLSIGIFDITASRSLLKEHGPNGDLRTLDEIISWVIPEPGQLESTGSTFCLHPSSGMVYQQSPSALAIYDFSTLVPRVFNFMPWGRNDVTSCLRLSPTLMAATSSTSLTILDSNYCSMQAECPLKEPEKVSRKGATDSAGNSITRLLSYFAPLDLLIALQGRRLIAIQLSTQTLKQFGSRKRARDGLLINSIGRGVVKTDQTALISSSPVKEPAFSLPKFESDSSWKKQRILLDQHARNGSLLEFESLMAQELKIELKENHEDVELVLEDETPHQPRQPSVDDWLKIRYLLSKIFSIDTGQGTTSEGIDGFDGFDSRLKIVFFPPRLFSWLAAKGYLSSDQVETSLKHHGSLPLTGSLATGTLFQALIKYDLSLQTLLSVLASPIYIGSGDLIQALGLSLGLLKYSEPSGHMKLITDNKISDKRSSSETPDGKSKPINAELDGRVLVDSKFGNGEVIQAVFRSIITKLHAFHGSEVTKTLKAVLSKSELLSLVDLLRMELAQNGWLSHYLDSESGPLRIEHQDNNQASMVAKLLNSVIDSLGTAGWILGAPRASDLTETADTISYMRAEISAALEGVEEATYLKGLLGELLLYGETVGPTTTKSLESASASLWTKPITVGREGGQNNYLPLGLKAPQEVSLTKVGAGGELQRRSMRDIGRLKSRMVGKYSFERIVI